MAGVRGARLILRHGDEDGSAALDERFVGSFDLTRKPMAVGVR
jgi:hypothetical protein